MLTPRSIELISPGSQEDIKMRAYGKVVTEKASTIIENPELMDLPQTNGKHELGQI